MTTMAERRVRQAENERRHKLADDILGVLRAAGQVTFDVYTIMGNGNRTRVLLVNGIDEMSEDFSDVGVCSLLKAINH